MLAIMAKMIRKERPEMCRLVSYQDTDVHTGGIYKAAGWKATVASEYNSWTNAKRIRPKDQSTGDKQRWELEIRPCATVATLTADPADPLKGTTVAISAANGTRTEDARTLLSVLDDNESPMNNSPSK
jgi:glutamate dehydrogenase/leucine dehydrogenase